MQKLNAIIEIPTGSKYKYEVCKDTGILVLDRVLNLRYPVNYGFLIDTLGDDGDALDVFVVSTYPLTQLSKVEVIPYVLVECLDNGVIDDKIICRLKGDSVDNVDVDAAIYDIEYFLGQYKPGFVVTGMEIDYNTILNYIESKRI